MAEEPELHRTRGGSTTCGERVDIGLRAMLTAKGDEGWELVTVTEGRPRTYSFFFKRRAED